MSDDGWEDDGWGGEEEATTTAEVGAEVGAGGEGMEERAQGKGIRGEGMGEREWKRGHEGEGLEEKEWRRRAAESLAGGFQGQEQARAGPVSARRHPVA